MFGTELMFLYLGQLYEGNGVLFELSLHHPMKINNRNNQGERVNAFLVIFTAGKKYECKSKKALHSREPCKKTFSVAQCYNSSLPSDVTLHSP